MSTRHGDSLISFWRAWKLRRRDAGFEAHTKPHIDSLWRTALRMSGDPASADELTQEACLRAYRAFPSFEPGTNYRAWIFRILVNLCLDHAKRRGRSPMVDLDLDTLPHLESLTARWDTGPEAQLVGKRARLAILAAMNELAPEIRLIVSLALLEERSYQEISEIAGCPIGTVRSRLSRGRQQLRERLREHLPNRVVALERSRDG